MVYLTRRFKAAFTRAHTEIYFFKIDLILPYHLSLEVLTVPLHAKMLNKLRFSPFLPALWGFIRPDYIRWTAQTKHFSLWNLLYSTFSSIWGSNICLRTLFCNNLSLCSSFNVRDVVSQPYSKTYNVIVWYTLIFKFLEKYRRQKGPE